MKKYAIFEDDENTTSSLTFTDNLQKDFIEFYQIEWDENFIPGEREPSISNVRRRPGSYEYLVSVFSIDPETSKAKNILECNFYRDNWQDEVEDFIREHWIELSRQMLESVENVDDDSGEKDNEDRILKFGEIDNKPTINRNRINNPIINIDKWSIY
jgi:hypothetical protein